MPAWARATGWWSRPTRSDGTFLKLPADVAIVTNIDPEHLDHFGTFDAIKDAFRAFVENIPFYGFAVMCIDHPMVQDLVGRIEDRRLITYGENPQADVRLIDIDAGRRRQRAFASLIRDRTSRACASSSTISCLPMPGQHNALNATAAIAVAHELGRRRRRRSARRSRRLRRRQAPLHPHRRLERRRDLRRLRPPPGRDRRGAEGGARRRPTGRSSPSSSRTATRGCATLFDEFCTCFNDADAVIVAPVYAAGEQPIPGADRDALVAGLASRAATATCIALERSEDLAGLVRRHRQARRLRRLPRRRQHHAMGLRACRASSTRLEKAA